MLLIGFFFMLVVTFGLVAAFTRPSKAEKAIDKRLIAIGNASHAVPNGSGQARQLWKAGEGSDASWFTELVGESRLARKVQLQMAQANNSGSLEGLAARTVACLLAGLAIGYYLVPIWVIAVPVAIAIGCVPYGVIALKRAKRIRAFNDELPNAADMMSRALRAGHSVVGALEILSEQTAEPAASEFGEVFRQQNFGLPLREALIQMMERVPSQDLRVLVTAILVQRETGGNLGEILDRTVFVIRERVRIKGEIRTQTAQGRLTGWILSGLPAIMLFLINLVDPGYSNILLNDPSGRKLIYVGMVLMVLGSLSIRHLINKIEV